MSLDNIPGFAQRGPCCICEAPGVLRINDNWYCGDHLDDGLSVEVALIALIQGLDIGEVEPVVREAMGDVAERYRAALDMGLLPDEDDDR